MFSKFATKLRKKGIFRAKNNLEIQEPCQVKSYLRIKYESETLKITSICENATISCEENSLGL
jgi:hypothetical protein